MDLDPGPQPCDQERFKKDLGAARGKLQYDKKKMETYLAARARSQQSFPDTKRIRRLILNTTKIYQCQKFNLKMFFLNTFQVQSGDRKFCDLRMYQ
jgi:hypothetical protein